MNMISKSIEREEYIIIRLQERGTICCEVFQAGQWKVALELLLLTE